MNWLDFVFLFVFVSSVFIGFARGLARTAVGLIAVIAGIIFASRWYAEAGFFLRDYVSSRSIASAIGFLLVLLLCLIVGGLVGMLLAKIFKWVGVGWLDRLLGGGFGVVRALLICVALIMIAIAFPRTIPSQAVVNSRFAPYIADAAHTLAAITPHELKEAFAKNYEEVKKAWKDLTHETKKLPETEL